MSRYQPRIIINDPEKNVPDNIVEQFFLTIKTGDIDKIREFANQHKNKYNLIEKTRKGSLSESGKTPFHVVLELDDKIADNNQKLRIMNFLDQIGAPMDLPDSADVWPIHLAAALQSDKIIDFLINKKVSLNRKDSSNNTPLHYAIIGKEVSCPKPVSVGPLAPPQKIDKLPLNKSLENVNNTLIKMMSGDKSLGGDIINDNLIHIINTIMKIPEMYALSDLEMRIQTDVIDIFSDVALTPTYSGGLTEQQNKLEQLVDKTYFDISENLLSGLIKPLSIGPNKGGWGPQIVNPDGTERNPNNTERILENDRINLRRGIENDYVAMKRRVTSSNEVNIDKTISSIPKLIYDINHFSLAKLIFCYECDAGIGYGEEVGLTKMLYLLIWNDYIQNYSHVLTAKIMDNMEFMTHFHDSQIGNNPYTGGIHFATNVISHIFMGSLSHLADTTALSAGGNMLDLAISNASQYYGGADNDCAKNALWAMFTNTDDPDVPGGPIDILNSKFGKSSLSDLFKNPMYRTLASDVPSFRPALRDMSVRWIDMLYRLIPVIKPVPFNPFSPNPFIYNIGPPAVYGIPQTPLPKVAGATFKIIQASQIRYTFHEIFRIMYYIEQYLNPPGFFASIASPPILNKRISEWENHVENVGNTVDFRNPGQTIGQTYPEFIFLYKILVRYAEDEIRKVIQRCIDNIIQRAFNDTTSNDPEVKDLRKYMFDDAYMYNLLMPSYPYPRAFNLPDPRDPSIFNPKAVKWGRNSGLVKWFSEFSENLSTNFLSSVAKVMMDNINDFTYYKLHFIRKLIEEDVSVNINNVRAVVKNNNFRNHIREYFGTFQQPDPKEKKEKIIFYKNFPNRKILPPYLTYIRDVSFIDQYVQNLNNLRAKKITDLFFLTETYGFFFVKIMNDLYGLFVIVKTLRDIISDIISFIEDGVYYYIPQIFLPAFIKQIVISVDYLVSMRNRISDFDKRKNEFYPLIDLTVKEHVAIIELGNTLSSTVTKQLEIIYRDIITLLNYHNNVIEFLNYHSAYRLMIRSSTDNTGTSITRGMFTMNLVPIEQFPNIFTDVKNFELLLNIMRLYQIPNITYHANGNEVRRIRYEVFYSDKSDGYRDIIPYDRSDLAKDSEILRAGDNLQLNIDQILDVATGNIVYNIIDAPKMISGQWLQFDTSGKDKYVTKPTKATYFDAFIAYDSAVFTYQWLNGMPPSIRELAGKHLSILKQRIIEEIIQEVIKNQARAEADPKRKPELVKMYEDIQSLGNETTYEKLDPVKIYIVIGKLADSLINKMLEYSIRQSISEWIYHFTSINPQYSKLASEIDKTVNMIRQKDYLRLSLQDINKNAINELLAVNPRYIDFKLTQIEPNPKNLEYVTKPTPLEFIHYLYDVNYFPTATSEVNKKCYHINTKTIPKIITGETINSKNSDGNTPLHLAVNLTYPALVELLMSKGANSKGFTNIRGQTPYDIGLTNAEKHLKYTIGPTVSNTIDYFVIPFNDLLLARLLEDKYKNNIVKNIVLGIPIQLIMYNHMFYIYLHNYRFGFSFELKNSIAKLLKKYYGSEFQLYPIDLFIVDDQNNLAKITEPEKIQNRAIQSLNSANQRKINFNEERLKELDFQLINLDKEWNQTNDPEQRKLLDDVRIIVDNSRQKLIAKIAGLKPNKAVIADSVTMSVYQSVVGSLKKKIENRTFTIVEFYDFAFGRLGRTNELYLGVWSHYLQKQLSDAPSMIFPLLGNIIIQIINASKNNNLNAELKSELSTIADFFDVVHNYIDSRESYPKKLEDKENPIINEDFNQLVYIINLILTPAMLNILLSQIHSAMKEMDGANTIIKKESEASVLDSITSTQFNGETIETFLRDRLPLQAIKYYTMIYDNDSDPVRKIINANDLFLPIVQIVKAIRVMQITDDSLLVQNLKDYIIPFMANTYQNLIHHLRLAVYGYERYLLNTYQMARILLSLV